MMDANRDAPHAQLAVRFAKALVAGNFEGAHESLSPGCRATIGPERLQSDYEEMVEYGEGPASDAMLITTLQSWADRRDDDLGWAYVAIVGEDFSEAVTVIVEDHEGEPAIRHLEWGRP